MSPLYNDAQVSRDAGKKIGIRERVLRRDPPTTLVWGIGFRPGGGWKSQFARYGTRCRLAIPYLSQEKYCRSFLAPSLRPRRPAGAFRRACIREDRDELFRLPGAFEIIHRGIEGHIHRAIEVAHRPWVHDTLRETLGIKRQRELTFHLSPQAFSNRATRQRVPSD